MAQIIVDGGGTWWSVNGGRLVSGVHATQDAALIEEAKTCGLDWVYVDDTEAVAATEPVAPENEGTEAPVAPSDPEAQPSAGATEQPAEPQVVAPETTESGTATTDPGPERGATLVVDATGPPDEPDHRGPMTLADIEPKTDFACAVCTDEGREKTFTTQAALMSHRRARHPDLDPSTGQPKQEVASPTLADENVTQPSAQQEGTGTEVGA